MAGQQSLVEICFVANSVFLDRLISSVVSPEGCNYPKIMPGSHYSCKSLSNVEFSLPLFDTESAPGYLFPYKESRPFFYRVAIV